MARFQWEPQTYLELVRADIPAYAQLEEEAAAAGGAGALRVLELGVGTGETTKRVLARHPEATVVGIDESAVMLAKAREELPAERVELRAGRLEDALPGGPFDLVVSALTVHHLEGPGKADLFERVARVLTPHGRFVLADLIVPEDPADAYAAIDPDYDKPSTIADQLTWLRQAHLEPTVTWRQGDLAVIVATRAQ